MSINLLEKIQEIIDYVNLRVQSHPFGKNTIQSWNVDWTQANSPTAFEQTVIDLWKGVKLGQTYTYDLSLVVSFLISAKKKFTIPNIFISELAKTLYDSIDTNGYVPFSFIQYPNDVLEKNGNFTGTAAWVGMSLLKYGHEYSDNNFVTKAIRVYDYIDANFKTSFTNGVLFKGGIGKNWYSTEHNVDMWHFLFFLYFITKDS